MFLFKNNIGSLQTGGKEAVTKFWQNWADQIFKVWTA
jgi:hypothetical protein